MSIPKLAGREFRFGAKTLRVYWFRVFCLALAITGLAQFFMAMNEGSPSQPRHDLSSPPVTLAVLGQALEGRSEGEKGKEEEAEAAYEQGKKLYESFRFREARGKLRDALQADPEHVKARYLLQMTELLMGCGGTESSSCGLLLKETRFAMLKDEKLELKSLYEKAEEQLLREPESAEKLYELILEKIRWSPYNIDEEGLEDRAKARLRVLKAEPLFLGEIVHGEPELGIAWIDLGEAQQVKLGSTFDVFSLRPGTWLFKGRVRVTAVEEQLSQVKVIEAPTYVDLPGRALLCEKQEQARIVRGDLIRPAQD